jgi:hypothetical protein
MSLQLGIADSHHPSLLSKHVQRPVAANGVEPLPQMVADLSRSLETKLKESVLNDLARSFYVSGNVGRVMGQRFLVFGQD